MKHGRWITGIFQPARKLITYILVSREVVEIHLMYKTHLAPRDMRKEEMQERVRGIPEVGEAILLHEQEISAA